MAESEISLTIGVILVLILLFLVVLYIERKEKIAAKKWGVVREGVYNFVSYGADVYTKRSGAMAHTTTETRHPFTAIYFKDGSTYVCNGQRIGVDAPSGAEIEIWRNDLGKHKILPKEKTS